MKKLKWIFLPLFIVVGGFLVAIAAAGIAFLAAYPMLPTLDALTEYRPKIPLRIYTADNVLIGEFGEERRDLVRISDVPDILKNAIVAAEDERFYQHQGFDSVGILRAALANISDRGIRQGASTITMQVARNFYLSSDKTYTRKFFELLLAYKIESSLTKDQILELYVNQIFLGQRTYGFSAAAQIYFGKSLKEINLAEAAVLAGLPTAPSNNNPFASEKGAKMRQKYVLRRMLALKMIDEGIMKKTLDTPLHYQRNNKGLNGPAAFVAEMARSIAYDLYQDKTYTMGLRIYTTIKSADQIAAYQSVLDGAINYDRRHGYRGAEAYVNLDGISDSDEDALTRLLAEYDNSSIFRPALVLDANAKQLKLYLIGGNMVTLTGEAIRFGAAFMAGKAAANTKIKRGAIVRVEENENHEWQLAQLPQVEASLVAANPVDGAITALVGGIDFSRSKFNHVSQAWRQPGSSFKPFIYSAALDKPYSPASLFDDEPISIPPEETGFQIWEPHNFDDSYDGVITMRTALTRSKNLVSIRILRAIGTEYARDYSSRFGFSADLQPPFLTLALGTGSVTPWQQLRAYSVFANGGYLIEPHIVTRIVDANDNVLARVQPQLAGDEIARVIDPRNAWMVDSMLHDVTRRGTAASVTTALKRRDLAGKTGTTSDSVDVWFCGYHPTLVAIAWMGFDQPKKLGGNETGGTAALPIWINFMKFALNGVPDSFAEKPEGLATINTEDAQGNVVGQDTIYAEYLADWTAQRAAESAARALSVLPNPMQQDLGLDPTALSITVPPQSPAASTSAPLPTATATPTTATLNNHNPGVTPNQITPTRTVPATPKIGERALRSVEPRLLEGQR